MTKIQRDTIVKVMKAVAKQGYNPYDSHRAYAVAFNKCFWRLNFYR